MQAAVQSKRIRQKINPSDMTFASIFRFPSSVQMLCINNSPLAFLWYIAWISNEFSVAILALLNFTSGHGIMRSSKNTLMYSFCDEYFLNYYRKRFIQFSFSQMKSYEGSFEENALFIQRRITSTKNAPGVNRDKWKVKKLLTKHHRVIGLVVVWFVWYCGTLYDGLRQQLPDVK